MPSTTPSETSQAPLWRVTTDRDGKRAYCLPTGQVVCKDGTGTTPATVYYAGFHDWSLEDTADGAGFGMTATVREAKEWAEADAEQIAKRDA